MKREAIVVLMCLLAATILAACSPAGADREAQPIEVAAEPTATQTAELPTPTPTEMPASPTPSMQTYSNANRGYSIQYPGNWSVAEDELRTDFISRDEPNTSASFMIFYTVRSEQGIIDDAVASREKDGSLKEVVLEDTVTLNGVAWCHAIMATNSSTFDHLYISIGAAGRAYVFLASSNDANHDRQTQVYQQMMESFQLLAPPTVGAAQRLQVPTPSVLQPDAPYQLSLYDDFSDPSSGWDMGFTSSGGRMYFEGRYALSSSEAGALVWSARRVTIDDFILRVKVEVIRGPSSQIDANMYGVIVRFRDPDNFYLFAIGGNPPTYMIQKREAGEMVPLGSGFYTIAPAKSAETLMVVADGPRFSFYVNDEHLQDVTDASFAEGDIALAGLNTGNLFAIFDNFCVWVKE